MRKTGQFALFVLSTSLLVGTFGYSDEELSVCKDIASNSATLRLKRRLFCDYDPSVRPAYNPKNATTVTLRLLLKTITINEHDVIADVLTWTVLNWQDEHLTWDPAKFDDIKLLHVKSNEIWVPRIVANNAYGLGSDSGIPPTNCWLTHDGRVNCVPVVLYSVPCLAEHSYWPYDLLYCLLELRAWVHRRDEMNFSFLNGKAININDYRKSGEWDLVVTDSHEFLETYLLDKAGDSETETIGIEFLFERNSPSLVVISTAPIIALTLMTLVTLWLDARSTERLVTACINFICHLLCIHDIHWKMPEGGLNPPYLLWFYEGSLVLATIALILTSFLRQILKATVKVPAWLSSATTTVCRSKVGQILLLSILDPRASATLENDAEDGANLLQTRRSESSWQYVALVIGWIGFIAVFVAYIVLFVMYVPSKSNARGFIIAQ